MQRPKKILFLVPYPLHKAPSQRFRVEAFFSLLKQNNIQYKVQTFFGDSAFDILYQKAPVFKKAFGVLSGFLKRLKADLFLVHSYDYVFIHREAAPIGPPVFEFIICRIWRKKIIYDFDDAIWIPNTTKENNIVNWLKAFWKIKYICKWAYKVVGGNEYLCNYARQYNQDVVLIPTCIDLVSQHNQLKQQQTPEIILGWTGSHSTLPYLDNLVPVLKRIITDLKVSLIIICNKPPLFTLPCMEFVQWKEQTEIDDLLKMNIGLMPLPPDPWCEGKCGFKLIQYLSLGIPAVANPVGVNKQIISHGFNGYLCITDEEWYKALKDLITNTSLREEMGKTGRDSVALHYNLQANAGTFLELFT